MIYQKRKQFVIVQILAFIIALLYEHTIASTHDYFVILIYSLWNSISYLWLFYMELKYAPDFNPYQVLALVTAQFIGLNGINQYNELASGESLYFGATCINDAMYIGIIYLSLQHLILFSVFYFMENKHKNNANSIKIADRIKTSQINYYSWAMRFYLFVWVMRAISFFFPLENISSVLFGITVNGHIVTLFLLTFSMTQYPLSKTARNWHWIIVVAEIVIVLNHGMKEEIIRTLVPYCIYFLINYKAGYATFRGKSAVQIAAIAAFVVLFVFPYVSIFRSISINTGKSWQQISTAEALSEYGKYINKEGIYAHDDEERGAGYLMSRAGAIGCNAFSIDYAKHNGTSPEFFAYCGIALIPRIIWPSKPQIVIGGMADALAKGESGWMNAQRADSYGNSLSLGYIGSCYFCLGFWGAIFLVLFQAFFLWYLWQFLRQCMLYNIVAIWAFSAFVFILLKDFESFADCGLNFIVFNLIYIFICTYIYRGSFNFVQK